MLAHQIYKHTNHQPNSKADKRAHVQVVLNLPLVVVVRERGGGQSTSSGLQTLHWNIHIQLGRGLLNVINKLCRDNNDNTGIETRLPRNNCAASTWCGTQTMMTIAMLMMIPYNNIIGVINVN